MTDQPNSLSKRQDNPRGKTPPPYAEVAKALMQSTAHELNTPHTEPIPPPNVPPVPFELWETLAYDLALANADHQTIADAYDITIEQLDYLQKNAYFTKILQAKKDEVKQLGSDATFAVKMRMVANRATPQLLRRLIDPNTNNRDFLAMYKTVTELGQLIPQPVQENTPQPTLIGASVTFNIGGVPGLEHLSSPITATSAKGDDNDPTSISEADWQEVITHQSDRLYDELKEL